MGMMNTVSELAHEAGIPSEDMNALKIGCAKRMLYYKFQDMPTRKLAEYLHLNTLTRAEIAGLVHVTKPQAMLLVYGEILHHAYKRNRDDTPMRVRVTGKCKTWKTRPDEFKLPVMYGLYESGYVTHENCGEWYVA